jgi:flagellar motility protein MotE (MotC chaperone)
MSKKIIFIAAAGGLLSFAATFGLSYMKSKKAARLAAEQLAKQQQEQAARDEAAGKMDTFTPQETARALTEKQLEGLIYDIRDKIRDYNKKVKSLAATEERVKVAQAQLKNEIDGLTELQTELAATVAALKQERDRLLKTRIEIEELERQNLTSIAATYDKMNATGAADIFTNMSKLDTTESRGLDDVVKILHFMNDRTKAKVLAELVNTEPKLAAVLSQELKRIREVVQ